MPGRVHVRLLVRRLGERFRKTANLIRSLELIRVLPQSFALVGLCEQGQEIARHSESRPSDQRCGP